MLKSSHGRLRRALWLGIMISLVVACAPVPEPDPARPSADPTRRVQPTLEGSLPSESGPPAYAGPAEPELTAERIWQSTGDIDPSVVALLENGVVFGGPERPAYLIGPDGREQWRLPKQTRLSEKKPAVSVNLGAPRVAERVGRVIAGAYTWDWCQANLTKCYGQDQIVSPEYGVVGLSVIDGSPLWSTVLVPSVRHEPGDNPELDHVAIALTTESTVLVTVSSDETDGAPAAVGTVALDPADGKKLWSAPGIEAEGSAGDKILGIAVIDDDPMRPPGYPVVLDARTGRELWRSPYLGSWRQPGGPLIMAATASGHAVAYADAESHPDGPRAVVVDLATGATTPFEWIGSIDEDENGVFFAWTGSGPDGRRIMSQPLSSTTPLAGRERVGLLSAMTAVGGHLWVLANESGKWVGTAAYDRTGGRRSKPVPGLIRAVDENWLITDDEHLTVYRVTP